MTAPSPIETCQPKVWLVDDDERTLKALRRLLRVSGYEVSAFESPFDFLSEHDANVPGCVVLDIGMDGMNGLILQERLTADGARRTIVFLTGCDDVATGVQAMKAGAIDYLLKPVDEQQFIKAVEAALAVDRAERRERLQREEYSARYETLTPRERQVMAYVVAGRLNKQIAYDLGIVEKTIKVHRAHVMKKMQVRSLAALVHIADKMTTNGSTAERIVEGSRLARSQKLKNSAKNCSAH